MSNEANSWVQKLGPALSLSDSIDSSGPGTHARTLNSASYEAAASLSPNNSYKAVRDAIIG